MKQICPELFRAGRLTPIECGYMTNVEINEMANYYFQRDFGLKYESPIHIPTSEVMEKLMRIMISQEASLDQKFQLFQEIFSSQNIF
jgi:hypothetical protein